MINLELFESSQNAPTVLKDIEETFRQLKKSPNNKYARQNLLSQIKSFTKSPEVVLFIDNEFNAGVITVYKKADLKNIIESTIKVFSLNDENTVITPSKLKNMQTVQESSDAVERIYVFIGKPFIRMFQPDELVAILLHEIGHVYAVTTNIPESVLQFFKTFIQMTIIVKFFLRVLNQITEIYILYNLIVFGLVHGITFTQRYGEYKADKFALKYGYGDSLLTALDKLRIKEKPKHGLINSIKRFFQDIAILFSSLFVPQTHPSKEGRIRKLQEKIFNEYKIVYPQYKDILDLVQNDYQKQEVLFK